MDSIAAVITIIVGSTTLMGFVMKFLLRETNSRLDHLEKGQEEFKEELRTIHTRIDAQNARSDAISMRLDQLYNIIIDKAYGIKR